MLLQDCRNPAYPCIIYPVRINALQPCLRRYDKGLYFNGKGP